MTGLRRDSARTGRRLAALLAAAAPVVVALAGAGQASGAAARGTARAAPAARTATVVRPAARGPAMKPLPTVPRGDLLAAINRERSRAGVAPLTASPALEKVAQARADELRRAGRLPSDEESFRLFSQMQRRIREEGYHPHGWTESVTATAGDAGAVIAYWKGDASFRDAMGADYRDVGIGIANLSGVPLYTFLFAWPEKEFFARQTAPLSDLAAVRAGMLAAVNAIRRERGLPELFPDARLDVAAQRHAEDMLTRAYYSHTSPDGTSPLARAVAAGYPSRRVAENIAEGEISVAEVMDGWMNSSGHRGNIVDERFTHLGVGLALGRFEDRYRILWVQSFGLPALPTADPLPVGSPP